MAIFFNVLKDVFRARPLLDDSDFKKSCGLIFDRIELNFFPDPAKIHTLTRPSDDLTVASGTMLKIDPKCFVKSFPYDCIVDK